MKLRSASLFLLVALCGCEASDPSAVDTVRAVEALGGTVRVYGEYEIKKANLPPQLKGRISLISLNNLDLRETDFSLILPCSTLKTFSFAGSTITDDQLRLLRNSKKLETLNLTGSSVTDESLAAIAEIPNLQHLQLDRCTVTDDGLKFLEPCRTLQTLELRDTKVTKAGAARLKEQLPKLSVTSSLALSEPMRLALVELQRHGATVAVGDKRTREKAASDDSPGYVIKFEAGWKGAKSAEVEQWLGALASEERVVLEIVHPAAELKSLGALSPIYSLSISDKAKWTDADLKPLAARAEIRKLDVPAALLTAAGFENIAALHGLSHLILKNVPPSKEALSQLTRQNTVTTLTLVGPEFTDATLSDLAAIPSLKRVELDHCPNVTSGAIEALRKSGIEVPAY